jgi:hypothetical protein
MCRHHTGVNTRDFFGSEGVEFAANGFKPVQNVYGFAFFRALEHHVFEAMRQARMRAIVPGTRIDHITEMNESRAADTLVHHAQAVGKGMEAVFRCCHETQRYAAAGARKPANNGTGFDVMRMWPVAV